MPGATSSKCIRKSWVLQKWLRRKKKDFQGQSQNSRLCGHSDSPPTGGGVKSSSPFSTASSYSPDFDQGVRRQAQCLCTASFCCFSVQKHSWVYVTTQTVSPHNIPPCWVCSHFLKTPPPFWTRLLISLEAMLPCWEWRVYCLTSFDHKDCKTGLRMHR